jgi:hypothetical protein
VVSEPEVVGVEPGVSEDGDGADELLFTETIRGATRTTCCAGIGSTLLV